MGHKNKKDIENGKLYLIHNKQNDMYYVGQTHMTVDYRYYTHIHKAKSLMSTSDFYCDLYNYPEQFEYITLYDNISNQQTLNTLESFYVGYFTSKGKCYNRSIGGKTSHITINDIELLNSSKSIN